ncbi:MAG: TPM domain-containing protein [Corticimicrobacter sp.]|uniref:TPM domain-containing protein n=1 Tax=Corticimicrobacter sp. TaxID=2678536 RepID=UPI0032DBA9C2
MIQIRSFLIAIIASLAWCLSAHAQYTVQSLPNPRAQGNDHYVSDPDGNLGSHTRAQLNVLSAGIEQTNDSEFAIVVVNNYAGDSDFEFALNLFSHWGIGKQGSDNGLLLFLSMDRREYRFITGYGLEGVFPDALLNQISERYLVPYLQAGNPDMAVLATAKAIESIFLSPEHDMELAALQAWQPTFWNLHAPALERTLAILLLCMLAFGWMNWSRRRVLARHGIKPARYKGHAFWYAVLTFLLLLFASLIVLIFTDSILQAYQFRNLPWFVGLFCALMLCYHFYGCRLFIRDSTRDTKTGLDMQLAFTRLNLVPLLLSPFAYKAYYDLGPGSRLTRLRATPPAEAGSWSRIHRDTIEPKALEAWLTDQQRCEERLGSRSYEIWRDTDSGNHRVIGFDGRHTANYETCPSCQGRTLKKPDIEVRKPATYSAAGTGERIQACAFCDYKISLGMVTLAQLQDSSSSSSSGGSSGGGSSGGSFGGGSSGGGGAGGRW